MEVVVVDTNILVRVIVDDEPAQTKKALRLMESSRIVILETVLLEVEWVLRSLYEKSRVEIVKAFWILLKQKNVQSHQLGRLVRVLSAYEKGFDFADALHHAGAEGVEVKSFDRRFVNRAKKEGWKVSLL